MKKLLKHIGCVIFLIGFITPTFAQRAAPAPGKYEAYPNPFTYRQSGWLVDGGLTGTFSLDNQTRTSIGDTIVTFDGLIRPGVSLYLGRYGSLKGFHKLIKYADIGLGYKMLWFGEKQNFAIDSIGYNEVYTPSVMAHNVSFTANINNVISLSPNSFIQNSLGVNMDYRFGNSELGDALIPNTQFPDRFVAQLHYKFAIGYLFDGDKYFIPFIELPIYTITPDQRKEAQLDYFRRSFYSATIGLRIFFFKPSNSCPSAR